MFSKISLTLLRFAPAIIGVLVVVAVSWALSHRPSDEAEWLQVEIPSQIARSARMLVSLALKPPLPGGFLRVDLHGMDQKGASLGFVGTSRILEIDDKQTIYRFSLPVPAAPNIRSVFGVIYLSPTGRWSDRTRSCVIDPVEISPALNPAKAGARRLVAAHEQSQAPAPKRLDSQVVRWAGAVVWLLAAFLSRRLRLGLSQATAGHAPPIVTRWAWLAWVCLLAAMWEAAAADSVLGDPLRNFAMAHGYYEGRRGLQEVLTVLVIIIAIIFAIAALRREPAQPMAVVFIGADVYWGISAVSFISLHDADAWLATPVWTIPVVQVVKLGAALVAVSGAARAVLRN